MKYRADIDGMRALAALSIVIFHINDFRLPGGFVGVDVFFVISGFLITSIVQRDIQLKKFEFRRFYIRRFKRLFPAMFAMLIATFIASLFFLFPTEVITAGNGMIGSATYASNILFYFQSGYFDAASLANPFLHTWSLSVEEQFYLVFPALVLVSNRLPPRGRLAALLLLTVLSFVLCQIIQARDPSAAFYLSPTRFWEFMVGAMLALVTTGPSKIVAEALSVAGTVALVVCFFLYNSETPYPGIAALLPCLATAALLFAGKDEQRTIVGRALSLPPVRWFGTISYSLYLWHWPIIVLYKLNVATDPSLLQQAFLLVTSIAAGAVSYYIIERPFRNFLPENGSLTFKIVAVGSVAVCAIGACVILFHGFPQRYSAKVDHFANFLDYDSGPSNREGKCFIVSGSSGEEALNWNECVKLSAEGPNVLLLGDSHAAQYYPGLVRLFPGLALSQITASGCRPVMHGEGLPRCTELMKDAFQKILDKHMFNDVILAGRWKESDIADLLSTVDALQDVGVKTVVLGPIVEYGLPLPRLLALNSLTTRDLGMDRVHYGAIQAIDKRLSDEFAKRGVGYFSIINALCPGDACATESHGTPLQFDYGHLTEQGSIEVIERIKATGLSF